MVTRPLRGYEAASAGHEMSSPSVWSAFKAGVARPSGVGLALIPLVAAAWTALAALLVVPERIAALHPHVLMSAPFDEYGLLTQRLLQIQASPRAPDRAIFVGSSVLKEGVWDYAELAADLSGRRGHPVAVENFTAGLLSSGEFGVVLEGLAPLDGAAVVLSVAPAVFSTHPRSYAARARDPRFGVRSETLDGELARIGADPWPRTGIYLFDTLPFYSARYLAIGRNLARGPPPFDPHLHDGLAALEGDALEKVEAPARELLEALEPNLDAIAAVIGRAVARARTDGASRIILLEGTVNPARRDALLAPDRRAAYAGRIRSLAADLGAEYWEDLDSRAALAPAEFYDHIHLRSPDAMRRYATAIADRLQETP